MNTILYNETTVKYRKLREEAVCPTYGTEFSAGADLRVITDGDVVVNPGETVLFHTGLSFEIPEGYVGLIFARSGTATKRCLAPANKVGVIDSDYRGEVLVGLHNHGKEPSVVSNGERVAQIMFVKYMPANFVESEELTETERGAGGYGSTGAH